MAIDFTNEKPISLLEAAALPQIPRRRSGKPIHVSCLYRWAQRGCRGIKLEILQVGGTTCTSLEALQRFFERLTAARNGEPTPVRTSAARTRAITNAERELEQAGI